MSNQTDTPASGKHSLPVAALLDAMDLAISLMLMTRKNERTVQLTKRVSVPDNVKRGLAQFQEYKCMFCGVRRKLPGFQVDHVVPVVRGGSNETPNLQLLCAPCNQRKGIQTNQEFYGRYRKAMRGVRPGRPPGRVIPQARFKEETDRTQAHKDVQKFKRTRYISPRTKINSGSVVAGLIAGASWFLGWNLVFPEPSQFLTQVSVSGSLIAGLLTWAGLMARAKVTGRYEQS